MGMREKFSLLIISRAANLYLARTIDLSLQSLASTQPEGLPALLDPLVLEIQRSLDYYQKQLYQAAPVKLLMNLPNAAVISYLATQLNRTVETLDLTKVFTGKTELTADQIMHCMTVIGGALEKNS